MRVVIGICLLVGVALAQSPAAAQDAEALRKELEQMRQQFEQMRDQYQKAIEAMAERLQRLEAQPQPAAPPPAVVQAPAGSQPAPGQPSLLELARPREPYTLYERRGPSQLLFDIGIVSDFIANFTQRNVDRADAGTFFGRENRIFPREIEVNLFGRIDPYAEGVVRFEFAEEFEGGERVTEVALAEAYLTLLTLPFGTQLRLGLMPVRFGLQSHLHREALAQPDAPNVLVRFLGEEQFREVGAELSWVAPLPFFLEALVGVFNGDNEEAFGRGSLREPLITGRLRTFFELGPAGAIQLGASVATGKTDEKRQNTIGGLDAKYKYTPTGWRHPLLTAGGEGLVGSRKAGVTEEMEVEVDTDGDGVPDAVETVETTRNRRFKRYGWYAWAEIQPWKQWAGGLRYDWTKYPVDSGHEWAIQPYITFMPSEFLRFRLAYKHTERSDRVMAPDGGGSGRSADEILLQGTFFLGAHAPHPF
jgi:hypothetical protein